MSTWSDDFTSDHFGTEYTVLSGSVDGTDFTVGGGLLSVPLATTQFWFADEHYSPKTIDIRVTAPAWPELGYFILGLLTTDLAAGMAGIFQSAAGLVTVAAADRLGHGNSTLIAYADPGGPVTVRILATDTDVTAYVNGVPILTMPYPVGLDVSTDDLFPFFYCTPTTVDAAYSHYEFTVGVGSGGGGPTYPGSGGGGGDPGTTYGGGTPAPFGLVQPGVPQLGLVRRGP